MKLISEYTENKLDFLIEKDEKSGKKKYAIQGIFAQAETKNRNGRIYPKPIMEKALGKYNSDQVLKGRAVGELNHPEGPTVNLDRVSHKIDKLEFLDAMQGRVLKAFFPGSSAKFLHQDMDAAIKQLSPVQWGSHFEACNAVICWMSCSPAL